MIVPRILLAMTLSAAGASAQSTRIRPPSIRPAPPVPGGTLEPRQPDVRQVIYFVLSESRKWTSTDGNQIEAKLVAFEERVVTGAQADAELEPIPPEHPTVVRDGKIRLLIGRKVSVVPLERLAEEDRGFVETVRVQREKSRGMPSEK